jgi:8-oxo-dGTP pyrophosphatase MutT (NUDIX family)
MKRYVVGFCFDFNHENVLLICKNRPDWQAGRLNGLGGKIEDGESPLTAVGREFAEETGGQGLPDVQGGPLTWRPFVRLRGADPTGESFEVWFFHARAGIAGRFLSELEGFCVDGEVLHWVSMWRLGHCLIVPNLLYLVPMAHNHSLGLDSARFFELSEHDEVPGECISVAVKEPRG